MKRSTKWRTILGLIFIYVAVFMSWEWAWGILFLYWVIPDIFSGTTYFLEPVSKKVHPNLYWVIIFSWLLMAFLSFSTLFIEYK